LSEDYFTMCYWPARQESNAKTAERLSTFLQGMALLDVAFGHWFEQAWSLKQARKLEFEYTPRILEPMLGTPKHASIFSAWNGNLGEEGCTLKMARGEAGVNAANCEVRPSRVGTLWERVGNVTALTRIMRYLVRSWEPDWGISTSWSHWDAMPTKPGLGEFAGWITYFSRERGTVPPLPAPVRTEPVEDKGTLVILTPERFTVSNPEHVALAERVRELLGRAGLLAPLRVS